MEPMGVIGAFTAGLLSFLSPCILPLLPVYLSVITGFTLEEENDKSLRWQGLISTIFFGIGFSLVFILMGATATTLGSFLRKYQDIFALVLGIIVIILGLHMAGIIQIGFLYKQKKINMKVNKDSKHKNLQAFLMGFAFAFGWTPCIGVMLGGILSLAAVQGSVKEGILLLSAYSFGLWVPFIIAALFTAPILTWLGKRPKLALRAAQVSGLLLVAIGVLLITGQMSRIASIFT